LGKRSFVAMVEEVEEERSRRCDDVHVGTARRRDSGIMTSNSGKEDVWTQVACD